RFSRDWSSDVCSSDLLGQGGVGGEVGEGDLGLDHPELGQVPARVAVLGAEGRAEGVDARQGAEVGLDVELARDGEVGLAAEEVQIGRASCRERGWSAG